MSESGKAQNAEAGAVDPASSVGAQNSSSLVRSSSSLRTLVEQQGDQYLEYLAERVVRELWVSSVGMVHSKPMRAREVVLKALRELAAVLSPVEQEDEACICDIEPEEGDTRDCPMHPPVLSPVEGRTNDDALSRSPADGSASTTGSPRTPQPEGSQR